VGEQAEAFVGQLQPGQVSGMGKKEASEECYYLGQEGRGF